MFGFIAWSRVKSHIWCAVNPISDSTATSPFHPRVLLGFIVSGSITARCFSFPVTSPGSDCSLSGFGCFMPHYSICTLIGKASDGWAHIQWCPAEHMVTPTWKWSEWIGVYLIVSKLLNSFCNACRPIFSWEEVDQISHLCRVSSKGTLELTP